MSFAPVKNKESGIVAREQARAKLNLTLHVKGKRPDGYHELESLVVFADLCDELSFMPDVEDSVMLCGPFGDAVEGENLVTKAKRAVEAALGREIRGRFEIEKSIPVAAGLGGGSSDAAAAIRALLSIYGCSGAVRADILAASHTIGADVPVCLYNAPAIMRGLGERVVPITGMAQLPALLVNPRIKLSTRDVFQALNAAPFDTSARIADVLPAVDWADARAVAAFARDGRNDLEPPALSLEPAVGELLTAIRACDGCLLARLSGSGPTCFGLFASQALANAAEMKIRAKNPHWWVTATTLS